MQELTERSVSGELLDTPPVCIRGS